MTIYNNFINQIQDSNTANNSELQTQALLASKDPKQIIQEFNKLYAKDPESFLTQAHDLAKSRPEMAYEVFIRMLPTERFEFLNEEERVAMIICILERAPYLVRDFFAEFQPLSAKSRTTLAFAITKFNGKEVAWNIEKLAIEEEEDRLKLFEILIDDKDSVGPASYYFDKFCISDKKKHLELMQKIVANFPLGTSHCFDKFDIEDENERIKLLESLATTDSYGVVTYFEKFKIINKSEILRILELLSLLQPHLVAENFDKFKVDDPEKHKEFAKKLLIHCCVSLSPEKYIEKFKIENEKDRFEILISLVGKIRIDPGIIKAFNIRDENNRTIVVMQLAAISPFSVVHSFDQFEINEEANRVKILEAMAKKGPIKAAIDFVKLNITSEANKINVLSLLIQLDPTAGIIGFRNIPIENESNRLKLAVAFAKRYPYSALTHFKDFQLQSESNAFILARTIFKRFSDFWSSDVENLFKQFESEGNRLTLALVVSRRNVEKALICLNAFNLKKDESRAQVAMEIGRRDLPTLIDNIQLFKIEDERIRLKMAWFITMGQGSSVNYSLFNLSKELSLPFLETRNSFSLSPCFESLQKKAEQIPVIFQRDDRIKLLRSFDQRFKLLNIYHGKENKRLIDLVHALNSLATPALREKIAGTLFTSLLNPEIWQELDTFKESIKIMVPYFLTFEVLLGNGDRKKIMDGWKADLQMTKSSFADGKNMEQMVHFLLALKQSHLGDEENARIINQIFQPKQQKDKSLVKQMKHSQVDEYIARMRLIRSILLLEMGKKVAQSLPMDIPQLKELSKRCFIEKMGLNVQNLANFDEAYSNNIATLRDETALFTYLSQLYQVNPDDSIILRKQYAEFILSLLNQTFPACRYENAPQLKKLRETCSDENKLFIDNLLEKWQRGETRSISDFFSTEVKRESFSSQFKTFLKQKLIIDGHLKNAEKEFPHLLVFLQENQDEESSFKQSNGVEKEILELCNQNANHEKLVDLAYKLQGAQFSQFKQDINEFAKAYSRQSTLLQFDDWKLVDSDNASDLLLLGRETGGCQNIDKDPTNNKSALAYMTDGKLRLLGVKDDKGKLVGRCIFRLMTDKKTGAPVLFLERYYTLNGNPIIRDSLLKFALHRAKELNLPLLSKEVLIGDNNNLKTYSGEIESVGSTAHFEYTDAGSGMTNGIYTIRDAKILYDPLSKA